jgi:hypothetical protein
LSIRSALPQVELAVGQDGAAGERIVLVARVLQAPTAEDRALLDAFAQEHAIEFWLQPGGPDTARPMRDDVATALQLALPEHGVSLPFGPTDFTQVNHRINEVLVGRALRLLAPRPTDQVVDFFCGLGNFTLPLARRAARAVGIEGNAPLLERAARAAEVNGLSARAMPITPGRPEDGPQNRFGPDAADVPQRILERALFRRDLGRRFEVLHRAAAARPGMQAEVRARRRDALVARAQDLDNPRGVELRLAAQRLDAYLFAGQRPFDEHHLAVVARNTAALGIERLDLDDVQVRHGHCAGQVSRNWRQCAPPSDCNVSRTRRISLA